MTSKTFDIIHDSLVGPQPGPSKVYLAGPMTGYPQFNFPAFDKVAAELRSMGDVFEVVSPAELDDPKSRAAALQSEWGDPAEYARLTGLTWADFLSRDVKLIADGGFDSIVCLPGWERSRGARLETFVGHLCGVRIFAYKDGGHIVPLDVMTDLGWAWTGAA
jgi:hypothetical protein